LFLINPNGIVFGPNASLDVQGSFLATTADAVKLGDAGLFSASQPATSNLLSVSPSALWFNAVAAQPIVNRSQAQSLINQPNADGSPPGLQVQPGRTLALVGGDVLLEGGNLTAAQGRIELGSVARVGQVSLTHTGNSFVLGYDSINHFGNISLSNRAFVDASGEGGGDIQILGGRLEMTQSSNILANTLGAENGKQVLVRATEVVLSERSFLSAEVARTGTGTGGDLTIDTGRLLVRDGAVVSASTLGEGKGGSLQITASDSVEVIGRSADGQVGSGLFATSRGSGDGGNLTIDTPRLLVKGGAQVAAGTTGVGNSGSLQVTASDSVEVIGISADGQSISGLFTQSDESGDAGNVLRIDTRRLLVKGGAAVSASTLGEGKGGSLQITASDSVEVIGTSADGQSISGLFASSTGSGDAGNLTIDTPRLLVQDGARVTAGTTGSGNGGSLQVTASDSVEVIGTSADGQSISGLFAQSQGSQGSGDAGDLRIDTPRLLVRDGAQVSTSTLGEGKGGSLQITASDSVELIGRSADGQFGSGLFATSEGSGDAGNLTIDTPRLLVQDGAQVSASTRGSGKGGSLQVTASDSVELIGESADGQSISGLFAQSRGRGDAGDLRIDTPRLLVQDGAQVSASTFDEGNGSSLQITASDSVELIGESADGQEGSGLFAESNGSGEAGDLSIDTRRLLVRDGAQVTAAGSFGKGKGGHLQITASDSVELIGRSADGQIPSGLFTASRGSGDAGGLRIDTRRLLVKGGAQVSAGTFSEGKGGSLQIIASDSIEVIGTSADGQFGSGLLTQSSGSGEAGDLSIDTRRLLVRDGAEVSAGTLGEGKGGKLQINASDSIEVIGRSADGQFRSGLFTASRGSGDAGDLRIDTGRLLVRDGAVIFSGSFEEGTAGNINITARDTLQANNGTIATSSEQSSGGDITIEAGDIRLFGDSDITTRVNSGAGDSGDIDLKADFILAFDDSDILAFAENGRGGNIKLETPAFFGENYRPAPRNTNPDTLDLNNRVDVNADAAAAANSGTITRPDTSFIQNSLTELPDNQIDTDSLLANSCIVRRNQPTRGSFTITGSGGLPQRPGDAQMSSFPTVDIETLPSDSTPSNTNPNRPWQKGDPIVEPQGVYRLPNGKLVLSRECSRIQ
jgi:large exoprotein involved in heme utilization and adhesion